MMAICPNLFISSSERKQGFKLFIKLVIFFFLFKIIDAGLFVIGSNFSLNEPYSYGSLSNVYSGRINTEIVCFGSSRIYNHINPAILESKTGLSAYNLGKNGTNTEQAIFTLEEYLIHNTPPKIIIFDADIFQLVAEKLKFEKSNFRKYQGLSEHTNSLFQDTWQKKISFFLVKSQIFSNQGIGALVMGFKDITNTNRLGLEPDQDFGDWVFIKGAHLHKGFDKNYRNLNIVPLNLQISEEKKAHYHRLVSICAEKSIKLILLATPSSVLIEPANVNDSDIFFSNLASNNLSVSYLSYFNAIDLINNSGIWYNASHLNFDGATIFTEKLGGQIIKNISDHVM